tara:strand:- start:2393 stop:3511 length:1119 start_codon:yes stop_codon:yes gene_type:complete
MTNFATRIDSVSISGIRKVFDAAGPNAINLGLGQPDFPTPSHIRDAAIHSIQNGNSDRYTPNSGILSLRRAISQKHSRDNSLDISPDNIIATAGGSEALHLAIEAHVNPGEKVLIPDPGFVSYRALTHISGGIPVPIKLRDDLTMDPASIESSISEGVAAFIVNSPGNPTGGVQSKADMKEFARIADDYDILCISDEVYEHFVFEGSHRSPMEFSKCNNVLIVNTCSKSYSMTGWRLGWVAGSHERIDKMLRIHQYAQACASAVSQHAALAALSGPQDGLFEMVNTFKQRRDVLVDGLIDMGLDVPLPKGAFYAFPSVPPGWVENVLDQGVIVVPGSSFGASGSGSARIAYTVDSTQLEKAIDIMRKVTHSV